MRLSTFKLDSYFRPNHSLAKSIYPKLINFWIIFKPHHNHINTKPK